MSRPRLPADKILFPKPALGGNRPRVVVIGGGIGVSGASPEMDDACARAGIEAITDKLEF